MHAHVLCLPLQSILDGCRLHLPHHLRNSVAVRMVEYVLSGKSKDECSGDVHAQLIGEEHIALYHKGGHQAIIPLNYNLFVQLFHVCTSLLQECFEVT